MLICSWFIWCELGWRPELFPFSVNQSPTSCLPWQDLFVIKLWLWFQNLVWISIEFPFKLATRPNKRDTDHSAQRQRRKAAFKDWQRKGYLCKVILICSRRISRSTTMWWQFQYYHNTFKDKQKLWNFGSPASSYQTKSKFNVILKEKTKTKVPTYPWTEHGHQRF